MQGSESVSEGLGPYEQACFLHASLHPLKPGSQEPSPGASQSQLEAIHAEVCACWNTWRFMDRSGGCGVISPLIWVRSIVSLLITHYLTTHGPPSDRVYNLTTI